MIEDWQSNTVSNFTQLLCDILYQKTYGIPFSAPIQTGDKNGDSGDIKDFTSACRASAKMLTNIPKAGMLTITMGDAFYR